MPVFTARRTIRSDSAPDQGDDGEGCDQGGKAGFTWQRRGACAPARSARLDLLDGQGPLVVDGTTLEAWSEASTQLLRLLDDLEARDRPSSGLNGEGSPRRPRLKSWSNRYEGGIQPYGPTTLRVSQPLRRPLPRWRIARRQEHRCPRTASPERRTGRGPRPDSCRRRLPPWYTPSVSRAAWRTLTNRQSDSQMVRLSSALISAQVATTLPPRRPRTVEPRSDARRPSAALRRSVAAAVALRSWAPVMLPRSSRTRTWPAWTARP